jgi:hypothetical protein
MRDFNLQKYLTDNPLTRQNKTLTKGKINEAFEGFGGIKDPTVVGDGVRKQPKDFSWDPTDTADYDEQSQPNKWIADLDRMQPAYGDWKASWEHPGLIVWSHADVPDAIVVATPGWDGKGTPVEFQSGAGSTQMLKILDQDEFLTFKDYLNAIKPYLDMVLDANVNPTSTDYETSDMKAPGMEEEGYMGTPYDSSEDMAVDMLKKGIRENDYFDKRNSDLKNVNRTISNKMGSKADYINGIEDDEEEMPSRIEGLVDQRELAKFAEAVMAIAQDLDDEGFDAVDIKKLLKDKFDDMIIA